jgi:hypothetical protein
MTAAESLPPRARLSRMIEGYRRSALVYLAAELGLAHHLTAGPRTSAELAALTGAEPRGLHQVARALAAIGVFAQDEQDRFALTEVGEFLDPKHPQSLHGPAVYFGGLSYRAHSGLAAALRSGGIAFDHVFGVPYYEHLNGDPALAGHYHRLIALAPGAGSVLASLFNFTLYHTIVDVGGGNGSLLAEILTHAPDAQGVLYELPLTEPWAARTLAHADGGNRCRFVAGDFHDHVPGGGDVYLLSRVLANWPDDVATRILANCRAAMEPNARLLVFELVMPDRVDDAMPVVEGDLNALAHLGGSIRTRAEFGGLLLRSGFRLTEIHRIEGSQWTLLESVPDGRS